MSEESSLQQKESEFNGVVIKCLPDTRFLVKLEGTEHVITAYPSGRMRKNHIRILEGDRVLVEMSPYDDTKGRIKIREK